MDLDIGDKVFYTWSTGLRVPAKVVGRSDDGYVELGYHQDGVRVVNHHCPMDALSFGIPSWDSPPPSPSSPSAGHIPGDASGGEVPAIEGTPEVPAATTSQRTPRASKMALLHRLLSKMRFRVFARKGRKLLRSKARNVALQHRFHPQRGNVPLLVCSNQQMPLRMPVLVPILLCQRRPVRVPILPLFLNPNLHPSLKQSPKRSPNPRPPRKRIHRGGVREREQENRGTHS